MALESPSIRKLKGQTLAKIEGCVKRIDELTYFVKSQSGNGVEYKVISSETGEWVCSCPDTTYRHMTCKHAYAVAISIKLREQVKDSLVIQPIVVSDCIFCHSSSLKKFGIRHNKSGDIQRFLCGNCNRTFSINLGFEKMKHNPQAVTTAIQLYFSGESLRNTQKSIRLLGVEVSHQTIYNWIDKYIVLMKDYVEKLKPNVSDIWRADELWIKVKGDMKYLFALMDDETRFWIAQEVADSKFKHDARNIFRKGKEIIGRKPMTLITDKLPAYHDAFNKEFWTRKNPRSKHVNSTKFSSEINNKMERFNGEVRDREKVMRGLKKKKTSILTGYQIYHNYIREHQSLNGKTPAELCGIKVEGNNKWITLIQNATKISNSTIAF
jgi:putative transposase